MIIPSKLLDLTKRISNRCATENRFTIVPKYFAGFGESRYVIKLIKYEYFNDEMHQKTIKLVLDENFDNEDNGKIVEDLFNMINKEDN